MNPQAFHPREQKLAVTFAGSVTHEMFAVALTDGKAQRLKGGVLIASVLSCTVDAFDQKIPLPSSSLVAHGPTAICTVANRLQ